MNIELLRDFCITQKGVTEEFPFDQDTLVFKVMGKMFCLISLSNPNSCNLKCDPEKAVQLREEHPEITGAFHMNKTHWNTVRFDGTLSDMGIFEWIKDSYNLVVAGLPKKLRMELEDLEK
ncbi:MmcQ/YjbR family DNA-binding protein [Solitalea sp. MAHUQ-68]|uniref:MmcQ/YjbR family DNA-binding protein n=1 Tax=Solitalea agri TaxID=2953739 RepID=A0A9X2F2C2_9SPHI|nr:MmcQ/YjbR family DNA-binding protein [Solitalea agri]MCO4292835.1 MmcQ/YjbR family DNA-binding protein [Solitalea agri]